MKVECRELSALGGINIHEMMKEIRLGYGNILLVRF
ncbi:hypothetical protein QFZ72_002464 [Bacillus sp. V2I10]|nr:hypothetical protein [Bacillus sp. V2I10]